MNISGSYTQGPLETVFRYNLRSNSASGSREDYVPIFKKIDPMRPPETSSRNDGQPVFYNANGEQLRAPKDRYTGFDHTPRCKTIKVEGVELLIYEYASSTGRGCRIEVVEGPDFVKDWVSEQHSGSRAYKARAKCINELKAKILEEHKKHEATATKVEALIQNDDLLPDAKKDSDGIEQQGPEIGNGSSQENVDEPESASSDEKTKVENGENFENGSDSCGEAILEKLPDPFKNRKWDPLSKLKGLGKKTNSYAKKQMAAGAEKSKAANQKLKDARLNLKKIELMNKKINQSTDGSIKVSSGGKEVTLTKSQAESLVKAHHSKVVGSIRSGLFQSVEGRVQSVAGRAMKTGSKQFGKELEAAPIALGDNLGCYAADALLNFNNYDNVGALAVDVTKNTLSKTTIQATKSVALAAFKGAVKEVAPNLVKKIPGVNILDAGYSFGKGIYNSKSLEEAFSNTANTGCDMAIQYASIAGVQALIPVPFVGAFVGSLVGGIIIKGKEYVRSL